MAFTDIDDTLIFSGRKLGERSAATVGAVRTNGSPASFATPQQAGLFALLAAANAEIIPVTGRYKDALDRVCLEFHGFAALSHGAVVMNPEGDLCPGWHDLIADQIEYWEPVLHEANDRIADCVAAHDLVVKTRVIIDQGVPSYVSIKGPATGLDRLRSIFEDTQLKFHRNDNDVALLPPYADKQAAVSFILEQLDLPDDTLLIGLGDSVTDVPFLRACHFGLFPIGSQIDGALPDALTVF